MGTSKYLITKGEHAGKIGELAAWPRTVIGGIYGYPIRLEDGVRTFRSDDVQELPPEPEPRGAP